MNFPGVQIMAISSCALKETGAPPLTLTTLVLHIASDWIYTCFILHYVRNTKNITWHIVEAHQIFVKWKERTEWGVEEKGRREGDKEEGEIFTKCYWFAADHEIKKVRIASSKFCFKGLFIG